jgi:ABC-type phosphate transport system substrate-binding protein
VRRRDVVALVGAAMAAVAVWDSSAGAQPTGAVRVIVHRNNASASADRQVLRSIFQTKTTRWASGERVKPLNLPRNHPARGDFDRAVLGLTPEESERYWIDRKIRGGAPPPLTLADEATVRRVVAQTPGAIGYVTSADLGEEVRVVAVIRDGKVERP